MHLNLPHFDGARVLVVGDVMLDRYWHGASSRISPEAPVPVVNIAQTEDRLGGAANVALNLAALGCRVSLAGVIGADDAGNILQRMLRNAQIDAELTVSPDRPTITKLRVISRHQQLLRMDFEDRFSQQDSAALAHRAVRLMAQVDLVVLSDYAKGSLQDCQTLISAARHLGVPVLVDPKAKSFDAYKNAFMLTPNYQEFEAVAGKCSSERELIEKGQDLISANGLSGLLITRGEQGMTLLRPGCSELHLPARGREVFDVTGAGDTVIATLAASLAAGEDLPESVAVANLAAGIVVGKLGTASVSALELRAAIFAEQGYECGVISVEQLLQVTAEARLRGESIVFTNGCFDIIHAGHVGYLEEARKLGSRLVVAINSDASVRRLKGEGRPINNQERRMAVLAGLAAVDWVVVFDEDTPESLLAALKPEVLVKGGDYREDQVVGAPLVRAYGGEVKVLSYFDNCSTTSIVNKLRNQVF